MGDLKKIREQHQEAVYETYPAGKAPRRHRTGECVTDWQPFPCEVAQVLAYLDELTEQVAKMPGARVFGPPFGLGAAFIETDDKLVQRKAVLDLLGGDV